MNVNNLATHLADPDRLAALRAVALLDTPTEESFDRLTWLAAHFLEVPVALVSLVDADRQFFKSCIGLPEPWRSRRETPLSHSFCQHNRTSGEPLLIEDARTHPLFKDHLAIRDLNVIAYLGIPLVTSDGYVLGSFCGIDSKPRTWTKENITVIRHLAKSVMTEIQLRTEIATRLKTEEERDVLARLNTSLQTEISSRIQAEDALREAEWKFQALFKKGPIGVSYNEMIFDSSGKPIDWRILDFNQSYKELTGVDPQGKTVKQAFPGIENDPFDWIGKLGHIARSGEKTRFEQYLQANDRWYDCVAYQYKPDHFVTAFLEITERKRAEEELRKSEARFRTLVQTIPDLVWLKDKDGVYLSCNRIFERFFGTEENQIVGKTDYDFVDRELADFFRAHDEKAIETGKPSTNEEWITFQDNGQRTLLETIKTPMYDNQGDLIGVLGIGRDITERRSNEEALQHYTFLMKEMGKAAKIGGWEFDAATGKGTWTEEVALIHELNPTDPADVETGLSFYTDESKARITQAIQDAIGSGKPYVLELELITAKGNHKWVKTIGHPIIENNKVVKVRGSFQDITERKRADNEREKLQMQLTQAQKMESVGRLAGGVAHDFNNMLGVILGYSELAMEQTDKNQPLHSALREIKSAAQRSADLTRQLLAFARKQTVIPKVLDLNTTVESMLSMLRRIIGEDIDMVWLPSKKPAVIRIDPSQVDQILANLCVNARDAISDNGKVTVETDEIDIHETYQPQYAAFQPGKYVVLAVNDNGCGMDEETQRKLFEPFFTTKDLGKGTGLGLASVYGIVKQNKGYINVYSELGLGTTFKIYLPLHKSEEETLPRRDLIDPAMRGTETILLVEDDPAVLRLTARMLEHLGYNVLKTDNPAEAIDLAGTHAGEIQLLLTDVVMPEINGRALEKHILSIIPGLKCLFMSGYTSDVIARHGALDEGVIFIQKPFSTKNLAAKIREALNR